MYSEMGYAKFRDHANTVFWFSAVATVVCPLITLTFHPTLAILYIFAGAVLYFRTIATLSFLVYNFRDKELCLDVFDFECHDMKLQFLIIAAMLVVGWFMLLPALIETPLYVPVIVLGVVSAVMSVACFMGSWFALYCRVNR